MDYQPRRLKPRLRFAPIKTARGRSACPPVTPAGFSISHFSNRPVKAGPPSLKAGIERMDIVRESTSQNRRLDADRVGVFLASDLDITEQEHEVYIGLNCSNIGTDRSSFKRTLRNPLRDAQRVTAVWPTLRHCRTDDMLRASAFTCNAVGRSRRQRL
jgi:hypothetical protein